MGAYTRLIGIITAPSLTVILIHSFQFWWSKTNNDEDNFCTVKENITF